MTRSNGSVEVLFEAVPDELLCSICEGSGNLELRNAYDLEWEGEGPCWQCSGSGIHKE